MQLNLFQQFVDKALSAAGDTISAGFMQFCTFVLGFFPDGDPAINSAISSWSFSTGGTTFNLLYFIDFGALLPFVALAVAIPFVVIALESVSGTVSTVNKFLDKLPFKIGTRS